ncbi:MAG: tail fiber protein [Candidatus Phlomobacter fragariae]
MIYNTGTVTIVSGSAIVKGTGTKWNSNNPLVSAGMLMLIKNGDMNYPYMIKAVNSGTELVLAESATFSATDTSYTINLTEPNNNSDAARALVAANTYILYFLQNMDTWMGDNGVVELTLPSGKTVKLESLKALQELASGKTDLSVEEIKKALEGKADASSVEELKKVIAGKVGESAIDEIKKSLKDIEKLLKDKADASSIKELAVYYPVGAPIPWPQATAPEGYLICDGQEFDKVKCPKLAQVYPSGRVPELRGEFIRGFSDGRTDANEAPIDGGRTVLSHQGDAIRNITGHIGYVRQGPGGPPVVADGAFKCDKTFSAGLRSGEWDNWGSVSSLDVSLVVPTAEENRPRNVAFLYIVRAE